MKTSRLMAWATKQARHDKRVYVAHLKDKKWMKMACEDSKRAAHDYTSKPVAQIAKESVRYLKMRASLGHDVSAQKQLLELTRPPMKFKGYVIGRKLLDGSRRKNFTYYPREVRGQPPFHFRTKAQAMKKLETLKEKGKFPGTESNAVVFKFTRPTYLDRY